MIDRFSFSPDVGNVTVYWVLQIIFYLLMAYLGYKITKSKGKLLNRFCNFTIAYFSIYEGLRWLRGADYAHYYADLTEGLLYDNKELLYKLIVEVFSNFPFYIAFIFYGFLLICPVVLLLKRYKENAYWILPLFILLVTNNFECLIRQYIATGFFLFGFYYWLEEKKKIAIAFFVAAAASHFAVCFPLLVFAICVLSPIKYEFKSPWIPIALFTAFYWLWNMEYLGDYVNYLRFISLGDDSAFGGYISDAERWFTIEGSISERTGKETQAALMTRSVLYAINVITIYYGFIYRNRELALKTFFWFTYWSLIIKAIAGDVEIILRFYQFLMYMTPFLMGILLCRIENITIRKIYRWLILLYYVVYHVVLHIGTRPYSGCGFIWDM